MIRPPPRSTLCPYRPLFRSKLARRHFVLQGCPERAHIISRTNGYHGTHGFGTSIGGIEANTSNWGPDRKSTRLNSSHANISYAAFCLKKNKVRSVQRSHHSV